VLEDYLLGTLPALEEERLEGHLFACAICSAMAEQVAGLALAIRGAVPPILARSRFEALEREGRISQVTTLDPGQAIEVVFPPADRLLVHRLRAGDLATADHVDVSVRSMSGETVTRFEGVPFDAGRGEVLVACQRHFAELFPLDIVLTVEVSRPATRVCEYTVRHRL
jgi:anti-sigma factor RsiW